MVEKREQACAHAHRLPETPEPAQRAGSARSGRRRDRTQHDRRHGEDVVSDEPDSQGETLPALAVIPAASGQRTT